MPRIQSLKRGDYMKHRDTRRRSPEYEPYDDYYQEGGISQSEMIDDSTMDPDLIEYPFGRIYTERRLVDSLHPPRNHRKVSRREPGYPQHLRRGNR